MPLCNELKQSATVAGFAEQLEDQTAETETLRNAFDRLQQKLQETRSTCEMLIAQHRRARTVGKANASRTIAASHQRSTALNRLRSTIQRNEANNIASHMMLEADLSKIVWALLKEKIRSNAFSKTSRAANLV